MTSAHYGSLMIIPSLGLLSGSLGLNLLRHFFSISTLLIGAIIVIALSGIWLMATPLSAFNLIWGFSWLCVAQGFSFPISMTLLLTPHKQQAGAVSALSGAVQMCIAGFLGALVVEFWVNGQQSLGAFYVFVAVCMLSVAVANIRHRSAVTA